MPKESVPRLLLPAIRADERGSFAHAESAIDEALRLGVGGFLIFGGHAADLPELTRRIREAAGYPIVLGSDLERGAGQQFSGTTALPPLAALGFLDDLEITRRAGQMTGHEARKLGLDLVFAPVADLANEPRNPIVGNRAFGADPRRVSQHVAAWIAGCRSAGTLACAKHFPGHGRTREDSHLAAGIVWATAEAMEDDLAPFRAGISAGVDALMTAHVSYPALDPSGAVATLSGTILQQLLRERLRFEGAVVTDALNMGGVAEAEHAAVAALNAGCDLLLFPDDIRATAAALEGGAANRVIAQARVQQAIHARHRLLTRLREMRLGGTDSVDTAANEQWAAEVARRAITVLRGEPSRSRAVELILVDDDIGGPHPAPGRSTFSEVLHAHGVRIEGGESPLLLVFADTRGWKGSAGLSARAAGDVARHLVQHPDTTVLLFGHPGIAAELPQARHVVCAWGGEARMQRGAAEWW